MLAPIANAREDVHAVASSAATIRLLAGPAPAVLASVVDEG